MTAYVTQPKQVILNRHYTLVKTFVLADVLQTVTYGHAIGTAYESHAIKAV